MVLMICSSKIIDAHLSRAVVTMSVTSMVAKMTKIVDSTSQKFVRCRLRGLVVSEHMFNIGKSNMTYKEKARRETKKNV